MPPFNSLYEVFKNMKYFTRVLLSCSLFCAGVFAHAQPLTVSAAASLTVAFTEVGEAFEKKYPESKVEFNFAAAAGALLQQIAQGAPVDVFVSADQEIMNKAQSQGIINAETRTNFIANTLVLIVPESSSLTIATMADLLKPEVKLVVLGNPGTTPIGRYVRDELQAQNQWEAFEAKLVLAETVRQSLNYVSQSEVDAGFVFATDARLEAEKTRVAFAVSSLQENNPFVYPIAVTTQSKNPQAEAFIAFVLSEEGQAILEKYGFNPILK